MFEILAAMAGGAFTALVAAAAGWWRERRLISAQNERLDAIEEELAAAKQAAEDAQARERRVRGELDQLVDWVSLLDPALRAEHTWERWLPAITASLEEVTLAYRQALESREQVLRNKAIAFLERTARMANLPPPDRQAQPDDRQLAILHAIAERDNAFFQAGWDHVLASPLAPPDPPNIWAPPPAPPMESPALPSGRPAWELLVRRAEGEMLPLLEQWLREEEEAHRERLVQEQLAHQRRCLRHVCLAVTWRLKNLDAARFDGIAHATSQDEIDRIRAEQSEAHGL